MFTRRDLLRITVLSLLLWPALCWGDFVQSQKFSTVAGGDSSHFGADIALSGDGTFAIVQAPNLNSAYAFDLVDGAWVEAGPINGWGSDVSAIARDGTTAVVGSSIFNRIDGAWVIDADYMSPLTSNLVESVALSADGNTAALGDMNITGPTGATNAGGVYVYTRDGSTWTQQAVLTATDGLARDMLGRSALSISDDGNTILVGARGVDIDTENYDVGAAYIFTRSGTVWTETQKLLPTIYSPNMNFANSVALSPDGNFALVGAVGDNKTPSYSKGAVHAYALSSGTWSHTQKLESSDVGVADWASFGSDIALSADGMKAIISDISEDGNIGAAYLFTKSGGVWSEQEKISPDDGIAYDRFGSSAAISGGGETILLGAWTAAFNATSSQGVVYAFNYTGDSTAPTIIATVPVANATGVATSSNISATFSEAMDAATLSEATFTVTDSSGAVSGNVSYNAGSATATFTPSALLAPSTSYEASITTGATDAAGNALASARVWTFTTGASSDTTPPTVQSTSPIDEATGVAVNTSITATFDEAMAVATITAGTFTVSGPSGEVTGAVLYDAGTQTATFTPSSVLDYTTTYTGTIGTGATDIAGNGLGSDYEWSFTTGSAPDITNPSVAATNPTIDAIDVAINTAVTATFDEPMDASTITASSFTLSGPSGAVSGAVSYSVGTMTATLVPTADLAGGAVYTATLTTNVADLSGNNIDPVYQWNFTTIDDSLDSDGDGVADNEDDGPFDPTHATPQATTGTGKIEIFSGASGGLFHTTLADVKTISPDDSSLNQTGRPSNTTFPHGLVSFTVEGVLDADPVTMRLVFPTPFPPGAVYYKVDSSGFHIYPHTDIDGRVVIIDLFDDGENGDLVAGDGVIQDPGGVGIPATSNGQPWYDGGCFLRSLE